MPDSDTDQVIVVCVKEHIFAPFSDLAIPVGSRWDATDPAVLKHPKNFTKVAD